MTAHSERKSFNSSSSAGQSQCLEHGWQHSICPSPARSHDHSRNLGCRAVLQNSQGILQVHCSQVLFLICVSSKMYLKVCSIQFRRNVSQCAFCLSHQRCIPVCILFVASNNFLSVHSNDSVKRVSQSVFCQRCISLCTSILTEGCHRGYWSIACNLSVRKRAPAFRCECLPAAGQSKPANKKEEVSQVLHACVCVFVCVCDSYDLADVSLVPICQTGTRQHESIFFLDQKKDRASHTQRSSQHARIICETIQEQSKYTSEQA